MYRVIEAPDSDESGSNRALFSGACTHDMTMHSESHALRLRGLQIAYGQLLARKNQSLKVVMELTGRKPCTFSLLMFRTL